MFCIILYVKLWAIFYSVFHTHGRSKPLLLLFGRVFFEKPLSWHTIRQPSLPESQIMATGQCIDIFIQMYTNVIDNWFESIFLKVSYCCEFLFAQRGFHPPNTFSAPCPRKYFNEDWNFRILWLGLCARASARNEWRPRSSKPPPGPHSPYVASTGMDLGRRVAHPIIPNPTWP